MASHTDAIEAKLSDLRRRELPIELFDHQIRRGARGERVGGGLFGSVGADRPFPFQKDHPRGAGRP